LAKEKEETRGKNLNQIPYDYTVEVRNTFKGLDLIDRVPDELWTEVRDIVQETVIKTIPKKKKCKKAKWLSEEALQVAVKRYFMCMCLFVCVLCVYVCVSVYKCV